MTEEEKANFEQWDDWLHSDCPPEDINAECRRLFYWILIEEGPS